MTGPGSARPEHLWRSLGITEHSLSFDPLSQSSALSFFRSLDPYIRTGCMAGPGPTYPIWLKLKLVRARDGKMRFWKFQLDISSRSRDILFTNNVYRYANNWHNMGSSFRKSLKTDVLQLKFCNGLLNLARPFCNRCFKFGGHLWWRAQDRHVGTTSRSSPLSTLTLIFPLDPIYKDLLYGGPGIHLSDLAETQYQPCPGRQQSITEEISSIAR